MQKYFGGFVFFLFIFFIFTPFLWRKETVCQRNMCDKIFLNFPANRWLNSSQMTRACVTRDFFKIPQTYAATLMWPLLGKIWKISYARICFTLLFHFLYLFSQAEGLNAQKAHNTAKLLCLVLELLDFERRFFKACLKKSSEKSLQILNYCVVFFFLWFCFFFF